MTSFSSFLFQKKFPSRATLRSIFSMPFTAAHVGIYIAGGLLLVSIYLLLISLNATLLVPTSARGGSLTEGIIGAPTYINPILATTETDIALTKLTYAGLMRMNADGTLVPELAESYTISPDGQSYTFVLKPKLIWSDHKALTAHDVAFTIALLQNTLFNTAPNASWQYVHTEIIDEHTITITTPSADPALLSRMTVGIMPEHVWKDIGPEHFTEAAKNVRSVSSGAFIVTKKHTQSGVPNSLTLRANEDYALGKPLLDSLTITAYPNQSELASAIESGNIDFTTALSPETISAHTFGSTISTTAIPTGETVSLYRSNDDQTLSNAGFLSVLEQYIDKNAVAATVRYGYGTVALRDASLLSIDQATHALAAAGYTIAPDNRLTKNGTPVVLSIAVENSPQALETTQALTQELLAIGITVSVRAFDPGTFNDDVADSVHRIVLATNRQSLPSTYRSALALYTETTLYTTAARAHLVVPYTIISPPLRYANAVQWYTNTDQLWPWIQRILAHH